MIEIQIIYYRQGGVGLWKLKGKVTGYLLFPGNNHVETVAMFDRLAKRGRRRKGDGGGIPPSPFLLLPLVANLSNIATVST